MKRLMHVMIAFMAFIFAFATLGNAKPVVAQDNGDNPVSLGPLPKPDQSGMAPVNDIKMYYAIYGKGEPLILLHGGLGNADYYANQIPVFAQKYQVIAVDSRGHGRSTVTDTPIGYDLMMSDVIALMDYLKIDSANLVGWSDGGIIGLDMAINHPERLRKLIAYGANYDPTGVRTDLGDDKVFNAFIAQAQIDYQRLAPDPNKFDAFLKNITNMWATEPNWTEKDLAKIKTPTLILDGWEEEAIYSEHAFKMAQLIPGAELHLMPGIGHFAMFKTPEMFNSIVMEYLSR
jgi:pimeloyl-ACP methyl ester carboxylesterase